MHVTNIYYLVFIHAAVRFNKLIHVLSLLHIASHNSEHKNLMGSRINGKKCEEYKYLPVRSIIVFISPKADTSDWSILFFATFYGKMIEWKQDDVLCAQQMLFFTYTLCMNTIIYEWFKITCEKFFFHFSQLKDYFLHYSL